MRNIQLFVNGKDMGELTPDQYSNFLAEKAAENIGANVDAARIKSLIQSKVETAALQQLIEEGSITEEELVKADYGFVNLHTSEQRDGKGDKVWWPLNNGKRKRHQYDPIMTRAAAVSAGYKIGD